MSIILASLVVPELPVVLVGGSISDTVIDGPASPDARAQWRLNNATLTEQSVTISDGEIELGGYHVASADYQINILWTGDTPIGTPVNANWYGLQNPRSIALEQDGVGTKSGSGTVRIRRASDQVIIATAAVSLFVEVEP